MAGLWTRASVVLRDNAGNICKVVFLVAAAAIDPSGGAVAAIRTAIVAITKAVSPRAETGASVGETVTGVGATDYGTAEDRAILTFSAADGSTEVYEIPGPINACFIAGSDEVDKTGTAILAVIDYITANGLSKFGQDLTYVKGKRGKKNTLKN